MLAEYTGQEIDNCVVRFTAEWCQPCKAYAPIFDKVADTTDVPFYVIDIEKYQDLAWKLKVQSIPALYAVRDGEYTKIQRPYDEQATIEALVLAGGKVSDTPDTI